MHAGKDHIGSIGQNPLVLVGGRVEALLVVDDVRYDCGLRDLSAR